MIEAGFSAALCRAARAAAGWSQDRLGKRALVSRATIDKFENERSVPNLNNLLSIRGAFEAEGFRFVLSAGGDGAEMFVPNVLRLEATAG